jgi:nucleoside-diphosphate-sugar epimerase
MRIGVLGLGFIGMPIASTLHKVGHEVLSWTRTEKKTLWENSTIFSSQKKTSLDAIVIASGATRPGFGNELLEIETTVNIARDLDLSTSTHVYYISSGAVYGECSKPQTEIDLAIPCTAYGKAKLTTEKAFEKTFGKNFTALRVGNVVDWENPYGIFREISRLSSENRILNFFGGRESSRDYLEMSDFVASVIKIIETKNALSLLNIGSGKSLTLDQLAHKISSVPHLNISIEWNEGRSQDVQVTQLDIALLKSKFEIVNSDFESGLEKYLRQFSTA